MSPGSGFVGPERRKNRSMGKLHSLILLSLIGSTVVSAALPASWSPLSALEWDRTGSTHIQEGHLPGSRYPGSLTSPDGKSSDIDSDHCPALPRSSRECGLPSALGSTTNWAWYNA